MMFTTNPFAEMERIQRQFDRAFNTGVAPQKTERWAPAIELRETADAYILRGILPGLETEALNIEASRKAVAISGKTRHLELADGNQYLYSEFPVGQFSRVIALPEAINHTEVKAEYLEGILTLRLPKAQEVINRVVKVNLTGSQQPELTENTEA
ncbi:MAG: Hsp20/alpha crystallin family protein [Microcoleaceae cyanobacterium]